MKKTLLFTTAALALLALAAVLIILFYRKDILNFSRNPASSEAESNKVEVVDLSHQTPVATESAETTKPTVVTIYFQNDGRASAQKENCGLVFGVERAAPWSAAAAPEATVSATFALEKLFAGPTTDENDRGFSSPFSVKTAQILRELKIAGDTAYVNLTDIRKVLPDVSSSCGSAQFLAEVGETLRALSPNQKIIYALNGNPKTFYDWIQIKCAEENNNCDPKPFK